MCYLVCWYLLKLLFRSLSSNTSLRPCFLFVLVDLVLFYLVFWLLSVNKRGLRLIIQTFEFWLKFGYITIGVTLILINTYVYSNNILNEDVSNHKYLRFVADIVMFLNVILTVIIISMFDALRINRTAKVLFSTVFAIGVTIMCVYWEYLTYFNGRKSVVYVSDNVSLSLLSIQHGMIEVIALFSWKQAILTMIRKGRCVLIKYSPCIEWETNKSNDVSVIEPTDDTNDSKIIDLDMAEYIQDTPTVEVEDRCTHGRIENNESSTELSTAL
eukprot:1137877_1